MKSKNLFADVPVDLQEELFETLVDSTSVKIERIISNRHASPEGFWYDQDQDEWVVVVQGSAGIRFEDETVELQVGDCVTIPAHKKHRVEWTSADEPTIWIAVHYDQRDPK